MQMITQTVKISEIIRRNAHMMDIDESNATSSLIYPIQLK